MKRVKNTIIILVFACCWTMLNSIKAYGGDYVANVNVNEEMFNGIDQYSFVQNPFGEERIFTDVISQSKYTDFNLKWEYKSNTYFDILKKVSNNEKKIYYNYNDKLQRVSKCVNGAFTLFHYNEYGRIDFTISRDAYVIYMYEERTPKGLIYCGDEYEYIIEEGMITGIKCNDEVVAEYQYENNVITGVFEINNGQRIINEEKTFIGNINKIRYNGWYFDDETGWIYNGRYYDIENNRYIDGKSYDELKSYIDEYGYTTEIMMSIYNYFVPFKNLNARSAPSYNTQIQTIACVIYGESHGDQNDQMGVAQVIQNRMHSDNSEILYGGKTAYEIVTAKDQNGEYVFRAMGAYSYVEMWNNTPTYMASQATENARRLYYDDTLIYPLSCYSKHTFFCSLGSAAQNISYVSGTFKLSDGTKITNLYITNYGKITNKSQILQCYNDSNYRGICNLFYNYK